MDTRLYAATHPAIRIDESADWAKVLHIENLYDVREDLPYLTWGYRFEVRRATGELRYMVTDGRSVAPVGALVIYMDDQARNRLRVEGRRGEVIRLDVANARVALDYLGEHVWRADIAASA